MATPYEHFQQHYFVDVKEACFRQRPKKGLDEVPDYLDVSTDSLDLCEKIRDSIYAVLLPSELAVLGDFYFGLTDQPLMSASIERVGASFLVLIHRRLFNAIQYLSDVASLEGISDEQKIVLLDEYLRKALSAEHLSSLPDNPKLDSEESLIFSAGLNSAILRYVLCHEIAHVLPLISEGPVDISSGINITLGFGRPEWDEELNADFFGASLPLRLQYPGKAIQDTMTCFSLAAPLFFHRMMQKVNLLNENTGYGNTECATHPPHPLRLTVVQGRLNNVVLDFQPAERQMFTEKLPVFSKIARILFGLPEGM